MHTLAIPTLNGAPKALFQNPSNHVVCRPFPLQKRPGTLPNVPGLTYETGRNGAF